MKVRYYIIPAALLLFIIIAIIIIFVLHSKKPTDPDLIVQLPKGKIRGHVLESESGKPYYAFQEIPYAAPPVGKNRFQLPKEPEPWSGILDTKINTVSCYQSKSYEGLTNSEDCLYLNVYTPVVPRSSEHLPVLVEIHGGGFTMGSGAFDYMSPKYLIDHGIILVSMNYRLGVFGATSTNDDVIPGNQGLKDQLLALEWVNENIELFGGNSSRVTISGESSAAMSVSLHMMGPWSKGKELFQAAILQSGSLLYQTRSNSVREAAFNLGRNVNSSFTSNDTRDLLELLQNAPPEKLLKGPFTTFPYVETTGPYSYQNFDCYLNGNFKQIPILIGFTSEELIILGILPFLESVANAVDNNVALMISGHINITQDDKTTAGHLLREVYTSTTFKDNPGAFIRFASDKEMCTPITKQAELHSKYSDVFLYKFSFVGPMGTPMNLPHIPGTERVPHAADMEYLFGDSSNSDLTKFPAEDIEMLHRMVKMWTNFVKYYNPTPVEDPLLENIIWKKVTPGNVNYLNINSTMETGLNPRYYDKVIKIMDKYVTPEVIT